MWKVIVGKLLDNYRVTFWRDNEPKYSILVKAETKTELEEKVQELVKYHERKYREKVTEVVYVEEKLRFYKEILGRLWRILNATSKEEAYAMLEELVKEAAENWEEWRRKLGRVVP